MQDSDAVIVTSKIVSKAEAGPAGSKLLTDSYDKLKADSEKSLFGLLWDAKQVPRTSIHI